MFADLMIQLQSDLLREGDLCRWPRWNPASWISTRIPEMPTRLRPRTCRWISQACGPEIHNSRLILYVLLPKGMIKKDNLKDFQELFMFTALLFCTFCFLHQPREFRHFREQFQQSRQCGRPIQGQWFLGDPKPLHGGSSRIIFHIVFSLGKETSHVPVQIFLSFREFLVLYMFDVRLFRLFNWCPPATGWSFLRIALPKSLWGDRAEIRRGGGRAFRSLAQVAREGRTFEGGVSRVDMGYYGVQTYHGLILGSGLTWKRTDTWKFNGLLQNFGKV